MKNQQPPEARVKDAGRDIFVNSIFYTVQGEGPHTGKPAVFIRLAGCNLQCPACDTEYTSRRAMTVTDICLAAERIRGNATIAVITGGEPFRQNIAALCAALFASGFHVQIETNGSLPPISPSNIQYLLGRGHLDVVVSPKTSSVNSEIWALAAFVKYVINADHVADDGLPTSALEHPLASGTDRIARPPEWWAGRAIYVNPEDSKSTAQNNRNLQAAKDAVMNSRDTRRVLGVQLHKLYGVD